MKNHCKSFILLGLLLLGGCKEFYDEEFEAFRATQEINTGGSGGGDNGNNVSYKVDLKKTDQNVPNLTGSAKIKVNGDKVSVQLEVDGIPANIIQIHYSYTTANCSAILVNIPNNNTTTRSYAITEETARKALSDDLLSSGAAIAQGDVNLNGKSMIVKAFSNFSGLPNSSGTNQITILCGLITIDNEAPAEDTGGETSQDGTTEAPSPSETPTPVPTPNPTSSTTGVPTSTTGSVGISF